MLILLLNQFQQQPCAALVAEVLVEEGGSLLNIFVGEGHARKLKNGAAEFFG